MVRVIKDVEQLNLFCVGVISHYDFLDPITVVRCKHKSKSDYHPDKIGDNRILKPEKVYMFDD